MAREEDSGRVCPHDMISDLPEAMKHHILRLLPRKYAIRTGVLSTQWKDLWKERFTFGTELEFVRDYDGEAAQDEYVREIRESMRRHGEKKIETFFLFFSPGNRYEENVKEWIKQAISCGVEELRLDFSQGLKSSLVDGRLEFRRKRPELKEGLFKGNCITYLSLRYCRLYQRFGFELFHKLEVLSLRGVSINDAMLQKAVANCQLLVKLEISDCFLLQHIKVSGPHLRLKRLLIINCWHVNVLELSAPNLKVFRLVGVFPRTYRLGDISSLVEANMVSFWDYYDRRSNNWAEMLMAIGHVEVLILCGHTTKHAFAPETNASLELPNVRKFHLILHRSTKADIKEAYRFLNLCHFPRLEKIKIELPTAMGNPVVLYSLNLAQWELPGPQFEQLKSIQLTNYEGCPFHTFLFSYLLQRAATLETACLFVHRFFDLHAHNRFVTTLYSRVLSQPRPAPSANIYMLYRTGSGYVRYPAQLLAMSPTVSEGVLFKFGPPAPPN